jgi:hypothetical protein
MLALGCLYRRPFISTLPLRPFVMPAKAGIRAFPAKSKVWLARLETVIARRVSDAAIPRPVPILGIAA